VVRRALQHWFPGGEALGGLQGQNKAMRLSRNCMSWVHDGSRVPADSSHLQGPSAREPLPLAVFLQHSVLRRRHCGSLLKGILSITAEVCVRRGKIGAEPPYIDECVRALAVP
jgi:hypothetical protein